MSGRVLESDAEVASIPERRPDEQERKNMAEAETSAREKSTGGEVRVWRCKVCGYLCARAAPPETCPICKVGRERFEPFELR